MPPFIEFFMRFPLVRKQIKVTGLMQDLLSEKMRVNNLKKETL